ncbi:MAG: cation-transporting P-type ATPase [Candidatus Aenigmarchaeota archaeon]|nr:cation-transporting P-type ATPase [Candidatus Aenigmarchaeota archaeon]
MVEWYTISPEQAMKNLGTSVKGLDESEAASRLEKYGLNMVDSGKKISLLKILFEQFTSILIIILIAASIISFFIGNAIDAAVILAIVILNGLFGFVQNYRAEKAIEALKKLAPNNAIVLRNGVERVIDAREIVPGDIVLLESGSRVPADLRIVEAIELEVDESILTGESVPVKKSSAIISKAVPIMGQTSMLFTNTVVSRGKAKAVAVLTGMGTEIGKMAKIIEEAGETQTPLQEKLDKLGKSIGYITMAVCIFIFFTGLLMLKLEAVDMFLYSISLAVAAVPEGLPAVVTLSLAIGVQKMVKKKALVRKLPAVEALGSVDVICTDKTGTITENRMTVRKIYFNRKLIDVTGTGYERKGLFLHKGRKIKPNSLWPLLRIGLLCNNATISEDGVIGDPTEAALIVSAEKAGLKLEGARLHEIPFDSMRKRMTVIYERNRKSTAYCKGAPSVVVNMCNRIYENGKIRILTKERKKEIAEIDNQLASNALRTLAFAYKDNARKNDAEKNLIFLGLQAMIDPPHKGVKKAIKQCMSAGVRVVMLTGDNKYTAKAIADEIGMEYTDVVTGDELPSGSIDEIVERTNIFARVTHEDKMRIMEALRKSGHTVAMTGDGVNDATALKKADIGIAMGIKGTDVAKEASDMVLLDDNFATIVSAIREGRTIYDNIRRFVFYLLSANIGEVLLIFLTFLFGLPLPLLAIQLLWINLLTDGLPALSIGVDPSAEDVMKRKPRNPNENILNRRILRYTFLLGTILALVTLGIFVYKMDNLVKAQTMVFTALVIFEMVKLEFVRSLDGLKFTDNKYVVLSIVASIALQLLVIYTPLNVFFRTVPLNLYDWALIGAVAVFYFAAMRATRYIMK